MARRLDDVLDAQRQVRLLALFDLDDVGFVHAFLEDRHEVGHRVLVHVVLTCV